MFQRTKIQTINRALGDAIINALKTRPGAALLATPTVRLASAAPTNILPTTVIGDFTEATWSGYTAQAISSWVGPVMLNDGTVGLLATVDFIAADVFTIAENSVAVYVTDDPNAILYGAERLDPQAAFAKPGDFLTFDLIYPLPLQQATFQL